MSGVLMSLSETPVYNLKVVLKETGIAADTLRAWERRYGLPKPQRTAGGHRLYSQHDIELIKWLMARQAEGLSISRAVDLWMELTASMRDPLADYARTEVDSESLPAAATSLDTLRARWLAACMAYNESDADQALNQAFALYPVEAVVIELLQAALHEMGEMWHAGGTSVQQEHFASALAARRLDSLISAAPQPTRKETILLACPPEELHAFPLLLLSLLLRRRGWNIVYLGADVPLSRLEETVQSVRPVLVVLAAQGLVAAAALRDTAVLLSKMAVPLAYGGRIFNQLPELRELIPGHFLTQNIQDVPGRIELLLEDALPTAEVEKSPSNPLARAYQLNRPLIEAALRDDPLASALEGRDLESANLYFGRTLSAALQLGQVDYLKAELDWFRGLSIRERKPAESLKEYFLAYSNAVRQLMGPQGSPVADWLDRYISAS
jgi:DNA-binding transcriptional MerR regulator